MLCLLGPPAVRDGERLTALRVRPKAVALLARLALDGPSERAELAQLLFGEAEHQRAALRWHLAYLRTRLPGTLHTTATHVELRSETDVDAFEAAAKRLIAAPDDPAAVRTLGLYRGDLCQGLTVSASPAFDTWLYVRQEALRRTFRQAVVAVARHALADADPSVVLEPLARLIAVDPYYEEAHVLLIEAHEALGQRDAAAAAYQRYQRLLRQELQTEPPYSLAQRYEPAAESRRTAPRDAFVALRELTLHVVDWPGMEPAIVAIHGSTMSAYTFTALAEQLAPRARFVAVDLRGHGFSDKPPNGYTVDQHVADLSALIDALELDQPVVLGFSIGGAIAAFVAARGGCRGLVLLDGLVGDRAFTENAAAIFMRQRYLRLDARFAGFEEYLTRWHAAGNHYSDEAERVLERTLRYELAPLPDGTYRRRALRTAFEDTWTSLLESNSLEALRAVRCPTLIVHATRPWIEGQQYLTDAIIAAQRQAVPQAQLFVARQSNHPTLIRDPQPEMIEAIASFVTALPTRQLRPAPITGARARRSAG